MEEKPVVRCPHFCRYMRNDVIQGCLRYKKNLEFIRGPVLKGRSSFVRCEECCQKLYQVIQRRENNKALLEKGRSQ